MKIFLKFMRLVELHIGIITLMLSLFAIEIALSQDNSKAILIDEFSKVKCNEIRSRTDNLINELINTPSSTAQIIIYGEKDQPLAKHIQKALLEEFLDIRKFDKNRITFFQGKDEELTKVQFWKLSTGVVTPDFKTEEWNYKLSQITKPFIIYKSSLISEVCPNIFNVKFYSNFLLANPDSKGHIVIYEKSFKDFNRTKKDLLGELVNKNKVTPKKIIFFYKKSNKSDIEFWFVPKNKTTVH